MTPPPRSIAKIERRLRQVVIVESKQCHVPVQKGFRNGAKLEGCGQDDEQISEVLVNKGMEPLTIANRDLERALVGYDDHHLSQGIMQDGASVARLQVGLNLGTKGRIDLVVDEI